MTLHLVSERTQLIKELQKELNSDAPYFRIYLVTDVQGMLVGLLVWGDWYSLPFTRRLKWRQIRRAFWKAWDKYPGEGLALSKCYLELRGKNLWDEPR